jgi:hypothetical protein
MNPTNLLKIKLTMNKQEQFFLIVQCGIPAYLKDRDRDVAPDIAMEMVEKAIKAAPKLPANLSALEAAKELIGFEGVSPAQRGKRPDWLN